MLLTNKQLPIYKNICIRKTVHKYLLFDFYSHKECQILIFAKGTGYKNQNHLNLNQFLTNTTLSLEELARIYHLRIDSFQAEKKKLEAESSRIVVGRMALFLLLVLLIYLSIKSGNPLLLVLLVILLGAFLYLVKRAVLIRREIEYKKILIIINENELSALNGDHSAFDSGMQFVDYQHEYSYDLDIFGEHSIYRLVNRVATPLGKEKLAQGLLNPGTDSQQILLRQEAVRELAGKLSWRQDFLATARESDWEQVHDNNVKFWLGAPDKFTKTLFYKLAIWVNSVITITISLLSVLPNIFPTFFSFRCPITLFLYFLIPISLIISRTRLINQEQQKLERQLDLFRKYAGLLELIEKEEFESDYSKSLKKSLAHGDLLASQIMKKLTGILWGLEVRGNMIVSFILNSFFLWDILLMIRLERWRHEYRDAFGRWIGTIAEFETLNSLANLSVNRPDLTWPEIRDGAFQMEIIDGGHPLINPAKRVDNSLSFDKDGRIYLITGANMAGKSTLLRMVGVNMILAMAGGPVCANRLVMVPVLIHTSVRTNDSLGDDESYFYAELKKLSRIINRFEQGERLFIIIDEMLKGTNSRDKHTGSAALIRRLIALGASGLVATHDVELGELSNEFPGRLVNRCFEVITEGDHLKFDYQLYPGISQNLNATFLMTQMGIIKE
jgi:hypothetical protein